MTGDVLLMVENQFAEIISRTLVDIDRDAFTVGREAGPAALFENVTKAY